MNLGKPKMRRIVTPLHDAPVTEPAYDDEGPSAPVTGSPPVPTRAAEPRPTADDHPAPTGG